MDFDGFSAFKMAFYSDCTARLFECRSWRLGMMHQGEWQFWERLVMAFEHSNGIKWPYQNHEDIEKNSWYLQSLRCFCTRSGFQPVQPTCAREPQRHRCCKQHFRYRGVSLTVQHFVNSTHVHHVFIMSSSCFHHVPTRSLEHQHPEAQPQLDSKAHEALLCDNHLTWSSWSHGIHGMRCGAPDSDAWITWITWNAWTCYCCSSWPQIGFWSVSPVGYPYAAYAVVEYSVWLIYVDLLQCAHDIRMIGGMTMTQDTKVLRGHSIDDSGHGAVQDWPCNSLGSGPLDLDASASRFLPTCGWWPLPQIWSRGKW